MKIVVTAQGDSLTSLVDPRFGRAKYFIAVDSETGKWFASDNTQNLNAAQGAGVQAASAVVGLGAEAVLTGHCGPKAFRALQAAGITVYTGVDGTVAEAVERFNKGDIVPSEDADVGGHWV